MKKCLSFQGPGKRSAVYNRWLRELLWRQRKSQLRGGNRYYHSLDRRRGPKSFVRIRAPKAFGLHQVDMRAELFRFFAQLRMVVLNGGSGAIVDFSCTERIYPAGGLLLVAELNRIKSLSGNGSRLRCKAARAQSLPDQVLNQIGIYESLGHPSASLASDQTVVHWHLASGLKAEGEEAGSILDNCDGELAPALRTSLYRGITEAMTNAVQHAYLAVRADGTNRQGEKRWWLFSQQREGTLYIVFCDLGIGIPESLPIVNSTLKQILSTFKRDRSDLEAIRLATKLGKTSTSEPNRGKGLPEILDAARQSEQGACVIYSNRGQYGFAPGGTPIENQFSNSIFGTLIEWRVPISEGATDDE
jgi:hypothetical protein